VRKLGIIIVLAVAVVSAPIFGQSRGGSPQPPKGAPTFIEEPIAEGKALIYIYSSVGYFDLTPLIFSKDGPITILPGGSYFPYLTDPGRVRIWIAANVSKDLIIDVLPGQAYYVRANLIIRLIGPTQIPETSIDLVPAKDAKTENEILYCKKIQ